LVIIRAEAEFLRRLLVSPTTDLHAQRI
jgi:hypothetical protein